MINWKPLTVRREEIALFSSNVRLLSIVFRQLVRRVTGRSRLESIPVHPVLEVRHPFLDESLENLASGLLTPVIISSLLLHLHLLLLNGQLALSGLVSALGLELRFHHLSRLRSGRHLRLLSRLHVAEEVIGTGGSSCI